MRVLVTETIRQSPTWMNSTIPLPVLQEGVGRWRWLHALRNVRRIAREAGPDDIVIFTDDHPVTANLFGLLQRPRRHRPTIVRTDPLLHLPRGRLKRRYLQAAFAAVDCIAVWAPDVARRYHEHYAIPLEKMVAVRFSHNLLDYPISNARTGDYIFSGGDSMRDYVTLIEAVRGTNVPVRIATNWRPPSTLAIPANVTLRPTSPTEFLEWLAGARFVVFPLQMDDLRTSGQQSYLNAMAMGKAVIVLDSLDAPFYIDQHRTGIVASAGDVQALREAIVLLSDNPAMVSAMGAAAQAAALPLDQEATWGRVFAVAVEAHERRQKSIIA